MGLLTPGYFHPTYWAEDYWSDAYWCEGGYVIPTSRVTNINFEDRTTYIGREG